MKYIKGKKRVLITALLLFQLHSASMVYGAIKFKDVPETHWAYQYVSSISQKGYMVGDATGNFNPTQVLDKFQTAKVLARMTGYKYSNLSEADTAFYTKVYNKNKNFLKQYDLTFEKWDPSADHEISYLLEKEILTPTDLNQFVILTDDGKEKLRALSKEELAMFMVKALGKGEDALSSSYDFKFSDDNNIQLMYKPYVYYLQDKGVFIPNAQNQFEPKAAVNRAMMAVVIDKSLTVDQFVVVDDGYIPLGAVDGVDGGSVVNIVTVTGTVDKYYGTLSALQIIDDAGKKNIYKLGKDNTITIDGFIKTVGDLKEGMYITGVLNNNEFVDIKAQTTSTKVTTNNNATNNSATSNNTTNNNTTNTTPKEEPANTEPTNTETKKTNEQNENQIVRIDGTVKTVDVAKNTITIETKSTSGVTETNTYELEKDCSILRDITPVKLESIKVGETIKAAVSKTSIYSIELEKYKTFIVGTLVEKKYTTDNTKGVLVVTDSEERYELQVDAQSRITRKGQGDLLWSDLKIGDTVEVKTNENKIVDLYAYGTKTTVEGIVDNVYISSTGGSITLKDNNNTTTTYMVPNNKIDLYALRIGTRVQLKLDSKEVLEMSLVTGASKDSIVGYVTQRNKTSIQVSYTKDNSTVVKEVFFNNGTVFVDSYTGNRVDYAYISDKMKVQIVLDDTYNNMARTITILT